MTREINVVILDSDRDGISQISDRLKQYEDLDAIHIISHGSIGELSLGNAQLNQSNINNYADSLLNWDNSLADNGDILLYGCNVAGGLAGAEFVKDFGDYTEADIAASTDLTGSKNQGGDWDLEYVAGNIKANLAFDVDIDRNYQYILNDSLINTGIPLFEGESFLRNLDTVITLPDSSSGFADRVELNLSDYQIISTPAIDPEPPNLLDPGMIDMINNSDFRIEYFPTDFSLIDSTTDPDISIVNFGEAENQPFSLYFGNGNFSILSDDSNYSYFDAFTNSLIFPFDASSLNFNPTNFEFTSVYTNRVGPIDPDRNSITFQFEKGSFDFSSLTDRNVLQFEFKPDVYEAYNINPDNTVRFSDNLTFEATGVSFRSDSVTFDYRPETFNFNPASFASNANLFKYKLSQGDFDAGVTVEQFNASDYRALDYAFEGDELFDFGDYNYTGRYAVPDGTNSFTSYNEDAHRSGANPNGLFDVDYYLLNNADVLNSGEEPLRQYATEGYKQDNRDRDPNALFDTSYYREQNPDIIAADANPLLHYLETGYTEDFAPRDPNPLFDSSYYKSKNPDVVAANKNPLQHYLEFGLDESRRDNPGGFNPNRDPSPFFDTSHYYDTHTDVRIASYELDSANALQHYFEFGNNGRFANEERVTNPLFETEYITSFSTFINSNSEGFESAQNEINNADNGIQIFPRDDGQILVASTEFPIGKAVQGLYYFFVGTVTYVFSGEIVDDAVGLVEAIFDEPEYSNYGFVQGDIGGIPYGTEPFPEPQEEITFTTFPKNVNAEDIINPANQDVFFTPLEPVEEINTPTGFPERDEILDTLLNEPLVFPGGEEVSAGNYVLAIDGQGTFRGLEINVDLANFDTEEEKIVAELLIAQGDTLIAAGGEDNVKKTLKISPRIQGVKTADLISRTSSGRFNLTEVKGSSEASRNGADIATAELQLKTVYNRLKELIPGGVKLGKVEVAVPKGASIRQPYEVRGNQIFEVTQDGAKVLKVGDSVITIRRF